MAQVEDYECGGSTFPQNFLLFVASTEDSHFPMLPAFDDLLEQDFRIQSAWDLFQFHTAQIQQNLPFAIQRLSTSPYFSSLRELHLVQGHDQELHLVQGHDQEQCREHEIRMIQNQGLQNTPSHNHSPSTEEDDLHTLFGSDCYLSDPETLNSHMTQISPNPLSNFDPQPHGDRDSIQWVKSLLDVDLVDSFELTSLTPEDPVSLHQPHCGHQTMLQNTYDEETSESPPPGTAHDACHPTILFEHDMPLNPSSDRPEPSSHLLPQSPANEQGNICPRSPSQRAFFIEVCNPIGDVHTSDQYFKHPQNRQGLELRRSSRLVSSANTPRHSSSTAIMGSLKDLRFRPGAFPTPHLRKLHKYSSHSLKSIHDHENDEDYFSEGALTEYMRAQSMGHHSGYDMANKFPRSKSLNSLRNNEYPPPGASSPLPHFRRHSNSLQSPEESPDEYGGPSDIAVGPHCDDSSSALVKLRRTSFAVSRLPELEQEIAKQNSMVLECISRTKARYSQLPFSPSWYGLLTFADSCHIKLSHQLELARSILKQALPARRKRNLSPRATKVLTDWLHSHNSHPYPTEEEKVMLALHADIQLNQVSNWFSNRRNRRSKLDLELLNNFS